MLLNLGFLDLLPSQILIHPEKLTWFTYCKNHPFAKTIIWTKPSWLCVPWKGQATKNAHRKPPQSKQSGPGAPSGKASQLRFFWNDRCSAKPNQQSLNWFMSYTVYPLKIHILNPRMEVWKMIFLFKPVIIRWIMLMFNKIHLNVNIIHNISLNLFM